MKTFFVILLILCSIAIGFTAAGIATSQGWLFNSPQLECNQTFCEMTESQRIDICPNRIVRPLENGGYIVNYLCGNTSFMEVHVLHEDAFKEVLAMFEFYISTGSLIQPECEHANGFTVKMTEGVI